MRTKFITLLIVAASISCGREPTATTPERAEAAKPDPVPVADAQVSSYARRVLRPSPALVPDTLMTNLTPFDANLAPGTPPG